MRRLVNIPQRLLIHPIPHKPQLPLLDPIPFNIPLHLPLRPIIRGIVNIDNMEVGVILLEDGVQVLEDVVVVVVVVAGDDYAEGELVGERGERWAVFCVELAVLLGDDSVNVGLLLLAGGVILPAAFLTLLSIFIFTQSHCLVPLDHKPILLGVIEIHDLNQLFRPVELILRDRSVRHRVNRLLVL